jgi:hypothetical protein
MSLCLCASALALAPPNDGGSGGSKAQAGFSGDPRVPANIGFSTNISPDKQALTVLFDNLNQQVPRTQKGQSGTLGQTDSQSKVFTLDVPFTSEQKSVRMAMDVRGFASADGDACVKLIAHAGETTKVIDVFEASTDTAGTPVKLKGRGKEMLRAAAPLKGRSTDFAKRVEFTVRPHAAKPVCQVTLILLAEHDTDTADSGGGVVMVDSLDLSFTAAGQGQLGR